MDKKILKQAAEEADAVLIGALPLPEDCPTDFSLEFEQKLVQRMAAEKQDYAAVKRVACILLAVVCLSGGLLIISPTARAVALGWLRESFGTVSVYLFQDKAPTGELGKYRLSEVPEGYTLWSEKQSEDEYSVIYENDEGLFFKFSYMIQPENGESAFVIAQMDHFSIHKVVVQETIGDYYLCEDGTTSNSVVWLNEEGGILFHLAGWFSEQELIGIANCINLVK